MKIFEMNLIYTRLVDMIGEKKLLPVKLNYAISKNASIMEQEIKIYASSKELIVDKFCHKDEQGNFEVKDGRYVFETVEKQTEYLNELRDLEMEEVNLEFRKVNVSIVEEMGEKYDILTAADLLAIDFMLSEE